MAVYGISKEGADALKQLATDMGNLNNDIQECGKKLTTKIILLHQSDCDTNDRRGWVLHSPAGVSLYQYGD